MKRLFVAVKINFDKKVLQSLQNFKQSFPNESIKWVDFSHLHITIKFLGDTEDSLIHKIIDSLNTLTKFDSKISLDFQGYGLFKNFKEPRVFWIGIKPNRQLEVLQRNVDNVMTAVGFQPENRIFHPHLTIGRCKLINDKREVEKFITANSSLYFQRIEVSEIFLIESVLSRYGPNYTDVERFPII